MTYFAHIRFRVTAEGHYGDYWVQISTPTCDVPLLLAACLSQSLVDGYYIGAGYEGSVMSIQDTVPQDVEVDSKEDLAVCLKLLRQSASQSA